MQAQASRRATGWFEGRVVVAAAAVVALIEVAATLGGGVDEASVRALIRITARTSLAWFALAFAARPLVALQPSPRSKWLLRNRRYLGLAMAVSHGAHLVAIGMLAARTGDAFWAALATTTLIGGGFGYVMLAAMVATSTDRTAAWLGRTPWRVLHLVGMWTFWVIFTSSYVGAVGSSVTAALATTVLVGVAGLRVAAWLRRRARRG